MHGQRRGRQRRDAGDGEKAKTYYPRGVPRRTAVREPSPTVQEVRGFVSVAQDMLAHVLLAQGDASAALDLYKGSRDMRRELVAVDTENADWRFILGVSYELIGNTYMRLGEPQNAVLAYEQELETMSALLDRDPDNTRWARAVSVTNELLGGALLEAGRVAEALNQFQFSLARMSAVRDAEPDNTSFQRFTSVTLRQIGRIQLNNQNKTEALISFRESAEIAAGLVRLDPTNGRWLNDLLRAQKGVVDAGGEPKTSVAAALETANTMSELGALQPSHTEIVDELNALSAQLAATD